LRGRAAELDVVLHALRTTRQGRATLIVVRGEPGIGKTAVVDAALEQAARNGFATGVATAHEDDRIAPLASLGPALRSGADPLVSSTDFLDLAPLNDQPLWLAERLGTLLAQRAGSTPLLIALDDAQWADPLSGFVLRILTGRLPDVPIAWLLATRDGQGGPADAILARAELPVHVIDLAPLTDEAVLAVAADELGRPADPGLAERLADANGIPFLAVQLLAGLVTPKTGPAGSAGLPTGLVTGVRQRIATTSDRCRELLHTAAVVGSTFRLDDVARLLGEPSARLSDPLTEAIDAGLLGDDGDRVTFRHDLLRQAVYQDLPPSARRGMHRSIVDGFLAAGRPAAEIAPHVLATAAPGDIAAVEVLRRAARELADTMVTTSVTLIRQAFALTPTQAPEHPAVGQEVVAYLLLARHFDEARTFADELLAEALTPELAATVRLLLAPRLWENGQLAELAARVGQDHDGVSAPLRARLVAYRALAGGTAERPVTDDPIALSVTRVAEAEAAEWAADYPAALDHYTAALEIAEAVDHPIRHQVRIRRTVLRAQLDQLDAEDRPRLPGDSWQAPGPAWLRAHLHLGAGRLADARHAADEALRLMSELADHLFEPAARHVLAVVALRQGDLNAVRTQLAACDLPVVRALLADAQGELGAAATLVELVTAARWVPWPDELLVDAACSAHRAGDSATLRAAVDALDRIAAHCPGVAGVQGAAALARGLVSGDVGPAVLLLLTSPRPLLLARAEEESGRQLLAADDRRTVAVAALDRARDAFAALGASADATRVQRVMHAAGVRRRRWSSVPIRPESGWDALTAMERRVALLIADGHTNRSAAAELVLSTSTISTHLRAVFTKLGVNSRVQLARLVLRDGTAPEHR
jgi:DNA-binding NarL/FixJ family response regulator